jgi:hypothetical protein
MIKVEDKDAMLVGAGVETNEDGCINPFNQDFYHMGTRIGKNVMVMMPNHDSQECNYLIVVNMRTGERKKLTFNG